MQERFDGVLSLIAPERDDDWICAHAEIHPADLMRWRSMGRVDCVDGIRSLVRLWEWQGSLDHDAEEIAFALLGFES